MKVQKVRLLAMIAATAAAAHGRGQVLHPVTKEYENTGHKMIEVRAVNHSGKTLYFKRIRFGSFPKRRRGY